MLEFNTKRRTVFLTGRITTQKSTELVAKLLAFESLNQKPIKLYINSDGGIIESGLFIIYDILQSLRSEINTFCLGQAFSAAAVLVASGTPGKRYIFPNATMMLHPPHTEIGGTRKEIQAELTHLQNLDDKSWSLLSKHTKQKKSAIINECQSDKYFSALEAVRYGLVDSIISPVTKIR